MRSMGVWLCVFYIRYMCVYILIISILGLLYVVLLLLCHR